MTTSIVLYLLATSLVASLAALAADEGLRRARLPSRWFWLVAMAGPPLLLIAPPAVARLAPAATAGLLASVVGPVVTLPALTVGPDGAGTALGAALTVLWLCGSAIMACVLAFAQLGLARERRAWERSDVLGRAVYLSGDRGPAIAGLVRPSIVLPRWSLTLPPSELGLVLLHEEEHVRGRDSVLLAAALALVILTPWNPVTWWQLRRLRMAMEVDCDRRVLRHEPDRARYGSSLLSVAARARGASLGLASFTERSLSLERRILAMTSKRSRWTPMGAATLVALSLLIGAQACNVENPVGSDESTALDAEGAAADALIAAEGEPVFTPFTDAPSILNREEVIDAMRREYPPLLREAGIGGTTVVYFFIDHTGRVGARRINRSSGHEALDQAALAVADVYRFSPALNRDRKVPVWVSFPITFQVE